MVKLTVPGSVSLAREAAALNAYAGRGAVELLARDDARGALLLERAEPGGTLAELGPDRDGEATGILCAVMQRLWREPPAGHRLPSVLDYGADFVDYSRRCPGDGPLPRSLVQQAAELLEQLSATAERRVLVHGDLHHHNVLLAQREPWLAIDPFGVVGDPCFDVGALLYNPMTMTADALCRLLPARLEQLADGCRLDPDRVLGWGLVMSVLSEVWSAEEHGAIDGRPLAVARAVATRMR